MFHKLCISVSLSVIFVHLLPVPLYRALRLAAPSSRQWGRWQFFVPLYLWSVRICQNSQTTCLTKGVKVSDKWLTKPTGSQPVCPKAVWKYWGLSTEVCNLSKVKDILLLSLTLPKTWLLMSFLPLVIIMFSPDSSNRPEQSGAYCVKQKLVLHTHYFLNVRNSYFTN